MPVKSILKSKTFWFNVLALAVGVAGLFGFAEFQPSEEAQQHIDAILLFIAAGVPIVNMILRALTDTAVTVFGRRVARR